MFRRRPALRLVLLFVAGIIPAAFVSSAPLALAFLACALLLFSVAAIRYRRSRFWADVLLLTCVVVLGALFQSVQKQHMRLRSFEPAFDGESILAYGTIGSEPVHRYQKSSFVVQLDSMIRLGKIQEDSRNILVTLHDRKSDNGGRGLGFGEKIVLQGFVEPFPFRRNPGEFDYGAYLTLNDVQGMISVPDGKQICILGAGHEPGWQGMMHGIQRTLYQTIDSLHSPRHASFLKGIIFGYRAEIPSDVKESFMETGTIHILAVSGSNVAFVTLVFYSLFGFFRLPRKFIGVATMAGLIFYMLLTGASASVVRATIMAIIFLSGTLLQRKSDIYNSISVAAFVLLVWNTNNLFDVGFQLSFAAVLSIVYFYPLLESYIRRIPERFEEIKVLDAALKLFAVSLAAQLGTLPFLAYHFGRVSIISLIANIPVVPLSGLNTFIGAAELIAFPASHWVAGLYAAANDFLVWFLLGFVRHAARVPFAYFEVWRFGVLLVAAYYAIVLGAFNFGRPHVRAWMLIVLLLLVNIRLFGECWTAAYPSLTATVMDVGQGDAILLEFSNRRTLLIDAGPLTARYDAGDRTVVPLLKRKGISRIDYFLVTHPHSDHIGGAISVLNALQVDTIVMNYEDENDQMVKDFLRIARQNHVGVKTVAAGDQISLDPSSRTYVLFPSHNLPVPTSLNNTSIVLKIFYGNCSILLAGDAEEEAEVRVCRRYAGQLKSDILKVGHHGGRAATSDEFLSAVAPRTAIISVGSNNRFGHPSTTTIQKLRAHSAQIERTDKSGAIVWESDGERWMQKEWRE